MPADRYALTCPCTCHGRGSYAVCDPAYPDGCGHLHVAVFTAGMACPLCRRPTVDALLCVKCTDQLMVDLADVPGLAAELELTRSKADRIGGKSLRGGSNIPLGYRPTATDMADVLHTTLAVWACDVAMLAGVPLLDIPAEHPATLARWLAGHREELRHPSLLADEIRYAVKATRRAVDRPAERVYAGPCDECQADLYAAIGKPTVECRACSAVFLTEQRRRWLLQALREHLATAVEIAQGIGELYERPINRKLINLWHHRDRLLDRGRTIDGRYLLFKIGDVLDLAEHVATRHPTTRVG